MQKNHTKNLALLFLATLFISTSGVLGRYIALPAEAIIFCRAILAVGFVFLYCKYKKIDLKIQALKDRFSIGVSGFLLGAHWVTYFYALKLSNVALGMLSLYTFPVITAFLEPLFTKQKINTIHIFLAILVLVGVYILVPEFSLENNQLLGILFGIISAFLYALRNLMIKREVTKYNGSMLMLYQLVIIVIFLSPTLLISDYTNVVSQIPFLVLIALLTTAIGHTLMVNSFQHFSVTTTSIISSVQPIFGIIMAFIFIDEIPTFNVYIGGSLILLTVIIESLRSKQ